MPTSVTASEGQLSRRDKFRAYMQAFNPTAPPRDAIDAGLVCEDLHQSLYRNLAARADLEPGSQQLLVGGVGSGKTTELILAERWLAGQGHVLPLYIDTSAETDLASLNSGALLATFGLHLGRRLSDGTGARVESDAGIRKVKENYEKVKWYAYGKIELVFKDEHALRMESVVEESGHLLGARFDIEEVPGKLKPALPPLNRDIQEVRPPLEELLSVTKELHKDIVVVFDGLDRLLDAGKFLSVVHQDLRLLRELKVSVIATAPLSVIFGAGVGPSISDHFDRVHHLTAIAYQPTTIYLWSVLAKRNGIQLLSGLADSVCQYSGGVVRDLISLARNAAEEAYVSDRDFVTLADLEKVVHQLGHGYLRGLGPEAIQTLLKLDGTKSIDLSKPENVELLLTRRVLEYSSTDFRVHPALLSVIPRPEPKRA